MEFYNFLNTKIKFNINIQNNIYFLFKFKLTNAYSQWLQFYRN